MAPAHAHAQPCTSRGAVARAGRSPNQRSLLPNPTWAFVALLIALLLPHFNALAKPGGPSNPVAKTLERCSWDRPGVNPFGGDLVAAVDRYSDIPAPTRARLKERMAQRQYDDMAVITRDGIQGQARYSKELRDMHFGGGTVCKTVTRTRWDATVQERGLVYCEGPHCLIVPTVCRNLSRVTRLSGPAAGSKAADAAAPPGEGGRVQSRVATVALPAQDNDELLFDPPSAGRNANQSEALPDLSDMLNRYPLGIVGGGAGSPTLATAPAAVTSETVAVTPWGAPEPSSFAAASGPGFPAFAAQPFPLLFSGGVPTVTLQTAAVLPAVPEPSTVALWVGGGLLVWVKARRSRKRPAQRP